MRTSAAERTPNAARGRAAHTLAPLTARGRSGLPALLLVVVPTLCGVAEDAYPAATRTEIRFAFSRSMFMGVNENDGRAAMKVYAQTIGDQNGIYVNSEPDLLDGTNAIAQALALQRHNVLALTAPEFLAMEQLGLEGPLLCSNLRGAFTEEYLLLSREDSPLRQIEDLKGRSLVISGDVRSCLAPTWLELLCREHGFNSATQALGKISFSGKTIQVVLPVFFGKADACIVTRNAFEVACELNPQLKKQLRVVAASPPLVPAVSCFRSGLSEALKQQIIKAAEMSSGKPAFRQIMTLFKADGVSYQPMTILDSTRELMSRYQKLCGGTDEVAKNVPVPAQPTGAGGGT